MDPNLPNDKKPEEPISSSLPPTPPQEPSTPQSSPQLPVESHTQSAWDSGSSVGESVEENSQSSPPPPHVDGPASVAVTVPQEKKAKKLPFMVITIVLFLIIAGYGISYLFMRYTAENKVSPAPIITPPVTIEPTVTEPTTAYSNPFATSSSEINPFATSSSSLEEENPFGTSENPFAGATKSGETENQPYQNPF